MYLFILENTCDDVTDEHSWEEDSINVSNLPGSQLGIKAEIENH